MPRYSVGLDFGTNSARALIVRLEDGELVAEAVAPYASGLDGVLLSEHEPDLARQSPNDLRDALLHSLNEAVIQASEQDRAFDVGESGRTSIGYTSNQTRVDCVQLGEAGRRLSDVLSARDRV
ncbi:MAG: hypothetical protein C4341_09545 [Armatimonadota bacterium]